MCQLWLRGRHRVTGVRVTRRNLERVMERSNRLVHEKSPYLLQHAHNPVDWYPWGPEAFERARREDTRPLV